MQNLSPSLSRSIKGEASSLASCIKITRRDGVVLGFTTNDQALVVDRVRYEQTGGIDASSIVSNTEMAPDNMTLSGQLLKIMPTVNANSSAEDDGSFSAYRDLCYVVIQDFALGDYDNKIPSFSFEVRREIRTKPSIEDKIKYLILIPGAGEFVYSDDIHKKHKIAYSNGKIVETGHMEHLNMHNHTGKANVLLALKQMNKTWRGRITANNGAAIDQWFTGDEGYNRFISHYANLTKGYVDAFIIGSEMVGLTSYTDRAGIIITQIILEIKRNILLKIQQIIHINMLGKILNTGGKANIITQMEQRLVGHLK